MQNTNNPSWDLVIRPQRGWFEIPFAEIFKSRELVGMFVWRDFVATYKQTILGPLWFVLQPILVVLTYVLVFRSFMGISTDGIPPLLFYFCGTVIWNYFSANFTKTSASFIANAPLFSKVYFPRLLIPVSIVFSNLIAFAIQLGLFFLLCIAFVLSGATIVWHSVILVVPICLLLAAGWGLAFGIIVCALTTRYRDLQHLVVFGNQLLFFATPVIYPISAVPEHYRWIVWMNPISPVIEAFRFSTLGAGTFEWNQLLFNVCFMFAALLLGVILFNRAENTFMDTI